MKLLKKQLLAELLKNKIFIFLMILLCFFTSFMYFFVHFSIDGNMYILNSSSLNSQQLLYLNALASNAILARNILMSSLLLSGFVFGMFYCRFFKRNSRQIGCLKNLGFKNYSICYCFVSFSFILSFLSSALSLFVSYFASDLLLQAYLKSYQVTGLTKSLSLLSILIGLLLPAACFCLITYLAYFTIRQKEIALLVSPRTDVSTYSLSLHLANCLTDLLPTSNKFSLRLALRKPISLILIFTAVTSFSVMFILAYSLNLSSQTIYNSQTLGYHYLYDMHFDEPQILNADFHEEIPYVTASGILQLSKPDTVQIEQQIISFQHNNPLFELLDRAGNTVPLPSSGETVIGPYLQELYGIKKGDMLTLHIGSQSRAFIVSHIAFNAQLNSVYISSNDLTQLMQIPAASYTGVWSMKNNMPADTVITEAQRLAALKRNFVSNRVSAVINQVIGCFIGCILLFLALLLNFQDSSKDMLILSLMGYRPPAIRKKLIDIYKPIVWLFFLLTLWPAILLVKSILKSLSLQIGDYMPFQTNLLVIAGIFIALNIIYFLVQFTFNLGIHKVIKSDNLYSYTSNE